jgi:hypothetical protein
MTSIKQHVSLSLSLCLSLLSQAIQRKGSSLKYIQMRQIILHYKRQKTKQQTPELQSARELYRPSDRRLSAKLVPAFADRGCRVVSATIPPQWLISVF